jgi:hypothetical protein
MKTKDEQEFKQYRRKSISEIRPYQLGEMLDIIVSISEADKLQGSPKEGDMIARNPKNRNDQWLVSKEYVEDNLEPIESISPVAQVIGRTEIINIVNGFIMTGMGTSLDGYVDEYLSTHPIQEKPSDGLEKVINDMIESRLHTNGFKEWMINRDMRHNQNYTEFYEDCDRGTGALTIDQLYKYWIANIMRDNKIPVKKD